RRLFLLCALSNAAALFILIGFETVRAQPPTPLAPPPKTGGGEPGRAARLSPLPQLLGEGLGVGAPAQEQKTADSWLQRAAAALNDAAPDALDPAFGGAAPAWARDWVGRLRQRSLLRQHWS